MRWDFTSALSLALEQARQAARRVGQRELAPLHLLQGLLHEEEGFASSLLARFGLQVDMCRHSLASGGGDSPPLADAVDVLLSDRTIAILHQAAELNSTLSGEGSLASDQVLLALLREEITLRAQLETMGLDFSRLETELLVGQDTPLPLDDPLLLTEPAEQMATARLVDANANRAREALRVLEDYCRFVLDDAYLSGELKRLRHDLTAVLGEMAPELLLQARDTLGDVGTTLSTPQEQERPSLQAVIQANSKRLQEALRSLEEFGKLRGPALGQALEGMRYRAYTLERALVLGGKVRDRLADARLYVLVTESLCKRSLAGTISEAAAGGAQIFQLREKHLDDRTLLKTARDMRQLTRQLGAMFIVNDRPDIAVLAEADGVHLGQDDLSPREARRLLGPHALIGVSTHNLEQVRRAVREGVSYIGVGPTFPSATKSFADFPGLEFVRQAVAETSLPAFVLGGVKLDNLEQVLATGARRVAVSHAICQADDPRMAAWKMRQMLEGG